MASRQGWKEWIYCFGHWQINQLYKLRRGTRLQQLVEMMKALAILLFLGIASCFMLKADDCPHDLEVRCIDDINKAYPICEKAAHDKGKDLPADLECLKYFTQVEKDCWPCICEVAKTQKWHIKGC